MEINSLTNNKVKTWCKYHQKKYRDKDKRFIVEGEHLIEEAISANCLESLIIRKGCNNIFNFKDAYIVSDEIIHKISNNVSLVDYIGICKQDININKELKKVILLDNVQDPGNVGTIVRTAYSFGYDAIYLSKNSCDIYNEKCIRSTQGALFHIPVISKDLIDVIHELKENDFTVYVTSLRQANNLKDIKKYDKIALVFGNEGSGVSEEIMDVSDISIKIEMEAFESLNVAIAAGICMYELK